MHVTKDVSLSYTTIQHARVEILHSKVSERQYVVSRYMWKMRRSVEQWRVYCHV